MKVYLFTLVCFFVSLTVSSQNIDFDQLKIEFDSDTAYVEQMVRDMLESDYSTAGMHKANEVTELEYDKLLNKYYKILYNSLDVEGKKALKQSQLNWIKLRDSDQSLIRSMTAQVYNRMGGGSIWGVVGGNAQADVVRRRVVDLYNYLQFSDIGGR